MVQLDPDTESIGVTNKIPLTSAHYSFQTAVGDMITIMKSSNSDLSKNKIQIMGYLYGIYYQDATKP